MTILYILISTDPTGGATKSFLTLLRGVLASGNHAIVVLPDSSGICSTLRNLGVVVWVVPSRPNVWTDSHTFKQKMLFVPRQIGRIVLNWWAERRILKLAAGSTIDIVHSNNTTTSLGRFIAKKRHIPHIYHIREYGDLDFGLTYFPSNAAMHRYMEEKGTYTISITQGIQSHHGQHDNPRATVIYNGIIDSDQIGVKTQEKRDLFLYAGRIEETKGLRELLVAYRNYVCQTKNPLPLWVAGKVSDENYEQHCLRYIVENNLEGLVSFLGSQNDMVSLYRRSKAIVIPSHYEGFGRSMAEAMAEGCIPVGHYTGGTREQLNNLRYLHGANCGYSYSSLEELSQCLRELEDLQGDELAKMQVQCAETVCQLYSNQQYVGKVLKLYEQILQDVNK